MTAKEVENDHESQIDFSVYGDPKPTRASRPTLSSISTTSLASSTNPPGKLQIVSLMRPL